MPDCTEQERQIWRDFPVPIGNTALTVHNRLTQIQIWSVDPSSRDPHDPTLNGYLDDADRLCNACRTHCQFDRNNNKDLHVANVRRAHVFAELGHNSPLLSDKQRYWELCVSELDHMDGGSKLD